MIEIARQRRARTHRQIGGLALQGARELLKPGRRNGDASVLVALDRTHRDSDRLCKFPLGYSAVLAYFAQALAGRWGNMLFAHCRLHFAFLWLRRSA
jgi:hypothetical protein